MRTILGDGNFKQEHLKMKYPEDDVSLSNGHGYLVEEYEFRKYLDCAPASRAEVSFCTFGRNHLILFQKSTCHEHDAVKSQNAARSHLDATGIGAVACARHGCFYPTGAVNFRKGEG